MFKFKNNDKEVLDAEIKDELEKIRELNMEELEQVCGGNRGDTREEYSLNPEDINRSIYGALYD